MFNKKIIKIKRIFDWFRHIDGNANKGWMKSQRKQQQQKLTEWTDHIGFLTMNEHNVHKLSVSQAASCAFINWLALQSDRKREREYVNCRKSLSVALLFRVIFSAGAIFWRWKRETWTTTNSVCDYIRLWSERVREIECYQWVKSTRYHSATLTQIIEQFFFDSTWK